MRTDSSERYPLHVSQAKATLARPVLLLATVAYSIQPIMIVTLANTMLVGLLFLGAFRVL